MATRGRGRANLGRPFTDPRPGFHRRNVCDARSAVPVRRSPLQRSGLAPRRSQSQALSRPNPGAHVLPRPRLVRALIDPRRSPAHAGDRRRRLRQDHAARSLRPGAGAPGGLVLAHRLGCRPGGVRALPAGRVPARAATLRPRPPPGAGRGATRTALGRDAGGNARQRALRASRGRPIYWCSTTSRRWRATSRWWRSWICCFATCRARCGW